MFLEYGGHHKINRKRKIDCSPLQLRKLPWEDLPTHLRRQKCIQTRTQRRWTSLVTLQKTHLIQRLKSWAYSHHSSIGFSKLWIRFHMNWFCLVLTSVGHFLVHMNTQTGLSMLELQTIQINPASLNLLRLALERNVGDLQFMGCKPQAAGCKEHCYFSMPLHQTTQRYWNTSLTLIQNNARLNKRFPTVSLLETTSREYMQLALKKTLSSSHPPHQCISSEINTSRLRSMVTMSLLLNLVLCSCSQS